MFGARFRRSVESCGSANEIPWVKFGKDDGKIAVMQPTADADGGRSPALTFGDPRVTALAGALAATLTAAAGITIRASEP